MGYPINVNPNFITASYQPLDARTVISNSAALANILMPYAGMHVWIEDQQKEVIVKEILIKSKGAFGKYSVVKSYRYAPVVDAANKKIIVGSNSITIPDPLKAATSNSLGGIKVGNNLSITSDGVLSGAYAVATASNSGLMSAEDKGKLLKLSKASIDVGSRKITIGSNSITVPEEIKLGDTVIKGFKLGTNVQLVSDSKGFITVSATDTTYEEATESNAGLMSARDKIKLDGLVTGFKGYYETSDSLPDVAKCRIGDFAVVGSTDTVWVVDGEVEGGELKNKQWKDTGSHAITPSWLSITGKPTTIRGYAITDAKIDTTNRIITLGQHSLSGTWVNTTIDIPEAYEVKYGETKITSIASGDNVQLSMDGNELVVAATDTTYSNATASNSGLMSTALFNKLNTSSISGRKVTIGSNSVTVPEYLQYNSKDVKSIAAGTNVTIESDSTGKITVKATDTTYSLATLSDSGLLKATDKAKLNKLGLGSITVTIESPAAARWSIDGGATWNTTGTKLTVMAGNYKVTYNDVEGYITPAALSLAVTDGVDKTATGTYTAASYIYYGYIPKADTLGAAKITNITLKQLEDAVTEGTVKKEYTVSGIKNISAPAYSWILAVVPKADGIKVMQNTLGVDMLFSSTDSDLQAKCSNGDSMTLSSTEYLAYGCVQVVTAQTAINFIKG